MENNVGTVYFISEQGTENTNVRIIKEKKNGPTTFKAHLQDIFKNRNSRRYLKETIDSGLNTEYLKERLRTRSFYGEAGHPDTNDITRQMKFDQKNISHIITDLYWIENGTIVEGIIETASTMVGRDMQGLIRDNRSIVAFSMRGAASVVEQKENEILVKPPLTICCYDWVVHPSHPNAYMNEIIKESYETKYKDKDNKMFSESAIFKPIEKEKIEFIKKESKHLVSVYDKFEIDFNADVTLSEDQRFISINHADMIININLEEYVYKQLNDKYLKYF